MLQSLQRDSSHGGEGQSGGHCFSQAATELKVTLNLAWAPALLITQQVAFCPKLSKHPPSLRTTDACSGGSGRLRPGSQLALPEMITRKLYSFKIFLYRGMVGKVRKSGNRLDIK